MNIRLHVVALITLGCLVTGCDQISTPPAEADAAQDGMSAADEGVSTDSGATSDMSVSEVITTPYCAINGVETDCSIVFTDVFLEGTPGSWPAPRLECESRCQSGWSVPNFVDLTVNDLGEQAHQATIQGISCATCTLLSAEPVTQYFRDYNLCTQDACAGATCTHVPWAWIGEACEVGDCKGTLSCDSQCKRFPDCMNPENLKICTPTETCPGD